MIATCPSCGRNNRIPASRLDARALCGGCKAALLPLDRPYEVKDDDAFDELVRGSPLPVVVDFWAPWCSPCRMIAPELNSLATRYAGRAVIAKVNTDNLGSIAERYRIRGIPTLLRFDRGAETKRISGAQRADALAKAMDLDRPSAPAAHLDGEAR
jgi:thioredoxin 2